MTNRKLRRLGTWVRKWAGLAAWVFLVVLAAVVFQVQQDQHRSDRRQLITNARNADTNKVNGCEGSNAFRTFFPDVIRFAATRSPHYDPAQTAAFIESYRQQFPTTDCKALDRQLAAKRVARFGEDGR